MLFDHQACVSADKKQQMQLLKKQQKHILFILNVLCQLLSLFEELELVEGQKLKI